MQPHLRLPNVSLQPCNTHPRPNDGHSPRYSLLAIHTREKGFTLHRKSAYAQTTLTLATSRHPESKVEGRRGHAVNFPKDENRTIRCDNWFQTYGNTCTRYVNMKPEFLYRKYTFMKMIKNILFEVLPIASYTFSPPVWQLVDTTPKKLSLFRGKPVIEPFSYIFVRSEALVRKCVSHRCK